LKENSLSKQLKPKRLFTVGGLGTERWQEALGEELLGSEVGDTAVKAKVVRAVTVSVAESLTPLALTLTVPLLTITPDQELVVPEPLTVLLPESLNCQVEKVVPVGALFTLHVAVLPRVTGEGEQLSVITLSLPQECCEVL
jgi:hypothetical protein